MDPEVAHVGLSEARRASVAIGVDTLLRRLADVDRARIDEDNDGLLQGSRAAGSDRIVGATIVARRGRSISELTLAIVAGVGLDRLSDVILPYPTLGDAVRHLADQHRRRRH